MVVSRCKASKQASKRPSSFDQLINTHTEPARTKTQSNVTLINQMIKPVAWPGLVWARACMPLNYRQCPSENPQREDRKKGDNFDAKSTNWQRQQPMNLMQWSHWSGTFSHSFIEHYLLRTLFLWKEYSWGENILKVLIHFSMKKSVRFEKKRAKLFKMCQSFLELLLKRLLLFQKKLTRLREECSRKNSLIKIENISRVLLWTGEEYSQSIFLI